MARGERVLDSPVGDLVGCTRELHIWMGHVLIARVHMDCVPPVPAQIPRFARVGRHSDPQVARVVPLVILGQRVGNRVPYDLGSAHARSIRDREGRQHMLTREAEPLFHLGGQVRLGRREVGPPRSRVAVAFGHRTQGWHRKLRHDQSKIGSALRVRLSS